MHRWATERLESLGEMLIVRNAQDVELVHFSNCPIPNDSFMIIEWMGNGELHTGIVEKGSLEWLSKILKIIQISLGFVQFHRFYFFFQ